MSVEPREQPDPPVLTRWARVFALLAVEGTSGGLALWAVSVWKLLEPYVYSNRIAPGARAGALATMAVGAGIALAIGLTILAWHRKKPRGLDIAEWLAERAAPLCVSGALPFLAKWQIWGDLELQFLLMVSIFGLTLQGLLRVSFRATPVFEWRLPEGETAARLRALGEKARPVLGVAQRAFGWRWLPFSLAVLASVFYISFFTYFTVGNHYNFCTSAYDLGIETNLVFGAAHGAPLFRSAPLGGSMMHGGFHQTYFAYVMAPIFWLVPRAETLLVIQAVLLGLGPIPLFLLAQRRIGPWPAAILCLLYVLYAPLHGANMYDFHYQPLGVSFLLLLFYLLDTRRYRAAVPIVLIILSIREDMGAMTAALGLFLLFTGERPRAGLALAAVGGGYFVAQKMYIMPELFHKGKSSFAFIYRELLPAGERGFGGALKTIVANPGFTMNKLLEEQKLIYFLQVFSPLVFLPWRRWAVVWLLLPGVVLTLFSTKYPATLMISFQYSAYWVPMVFIGSVIVLQRLGEQESRGIIPPVSRRAWLGAIVFAMLLTSNRFGVIFQDETAQGAFDPVHFGHTEEDHERNRDFEALHAQIPPDAKVVASEWLIAHVANRYDAYTLRQGVLDAEYLVFWKYLRRDERPVVQKALRGKFGVMEIRGDFVLARRGYSTQNNGEALRMLRTVRSGRPPR
jgi:uncharacterized membrane protein